MEASSNNNADLSDHTIGHKSHSDEQHQFQFQPQQSSGMTPSIITTINNTSPTPINHSNNNMVSAENLNSKFRRPSQPYYESYIEDSFVGHWEHEDDDPAEPNNPYRTNEDGRPNSSDQDEDAILHPSTIEFDFDSFGPESFIYSSGQQGVNTTQTPLPAVNLEEDEDEETQHNSVVEVHSKPNGEESSEPETHKDGAHQLELRDEGDLVERIFEPSTQDTAPRASTWALLNDPSFANSIVDFAQIDLKVIEPYKKVISHAGYSHHIDPSFPRPAPGDSAPAIIIFSACYLPDRSRRDYDYVMDHLFLYVLSSLHELIADDYILIYLHNTQPSNSSPRPVKTSSGYGSNQQDVSNSLSNNSDDSPKLNNLPTFTWIKRCYQLIDRRLRKNLKILYLIKPTFWLKTIVIMCKPFISSKFSKKIRFVQDINSLRKCLPVDQLILPASAENL